MIHISIVTGTYNRPKTLARMMNTVRRTLPDALNIEFVIVDNGTKDDAAEKAVAHLPDVRFIQLGEPKGAIHAFTKGARMARGKYVLLATDDIQFPPGSILRAWSYIEDHPLCGAVAFQHNKWEDRKYRVDYHTVRREDGSRSRAIYPQIALVRKWVGDECGWWGGDHHIMKNAFTYAGDNFLGARIIEMGYTVDAVAGVRDDEDVIDDEPRKMNAARHYNDAMLFFSIWKDKPLMREKPVMTRDDDREALRILYLNHFNPAMPEHKAGKVGLKQALKRVSVCMEYDFAGAGDDNARELPQIAKWFQPHIILMQLHRPALISHQTIKAMRDMAPNAIMLNRIGDVWERYHTDRECVVAWRLMDGVLVVNADMIPKMEAHDVRAYYWPHSFEPVPDAEIEVPAHDVVFQGNGYSEHRKRLGEIVHNVGGGLYAMNGHRVPTSGSTHYQFAKARAIYANAKIAISDNDFHASGYVSNRLFEIISAGGALCLQQNPVDYDKYIGLKEGTHYIAWDTLDDLQEKIKYWLDPENQTRRRQIVRNAHRQAHTNHTFDNRVKELLLDIIPEVAKDAQRVPELA